MLILHTGCLHVSGVIDREIDILHEHEGERMILSFLPCQGCGIAPRTIPDQLRQPAWVLCCTPAPTLHVMRYWQQFQPEKVPRLKEQ